MDDKIPFYALDLGNINKNTRAMPNGQYGVLNFQPVWYLILLHIMCGYQCDKAVNKNDTREVIWYHFTEWNYTISLHGFELSN